jgi:hypothetical protein
MEKTFQLKKVEELIVHDEKFLFTAISGLMILIISLNSIFSLSPAIGLIASLIFFLINILFLGNIFFDEKVQFLRFVLGSLMLFLFLGITGWVVLIIYKLDITGSALTLFILAGLSSTMNRLKKRREKRVPK